MMVFADRVLEIVEEAKKRNYPEFILKYDLNNYITSVLKEEESYYDKELEWARDDSYDEGKEDGYQDGYDDGVEAGKDDLRDEIMKKLADEVIKLKEFIRDNSCTREEIQLKITEMLVAVDDYEILPYTHKYCKVEEIDSLYNDKED